MTKARWMWGALLAVLFSIFTQGCKFEDRSTRTQIREDSVRVKAEAGDSLRKADSLDLPSQSTSEN